jgi:PAS domain S-box-containing protein
VCAVATPRVRWALLALAVGLLSWAELLAPLDRLLIDARAGLASREATGRVVVVGIDAESLDALGRWPWPRRRHADLVARLLAAGAGRIALDVDFSGAADPGEDGALAAALAEGGPSRVALAAYRQHQPMPAGPARVVETVPTAGLVAAAALATVNVVPDSDGLVRLYPPGDRLAGLWRPSLAAWAVGAAEGEPGHDLRIDYTIDVGAIPYLSYQDVLAGRLDPAWLAGRAVLVGAIDPALGDTVATPRWRALPGVMVHALAAETLLQERGLQILGGRPVGAALALLLFLLGSRLERGPPALAVAGGAGLALAAAVAAAALQLVWSRTFALGPVVLAWLAAASLVTVLDRARLRAARQAAALEAERRRRLVEGIVRTSFDGILTVAADGRILTANPAAAQILGLSADRIVGRTLAALDPALGAALPDPSGRTGCRSELRLDRTGGRGQTLETVATRLVDAVAGEIDVVVLRDVSEARATAAALDRLLHHDGPSGLPNRTLLERTLATMLGDDAATGGRLAVVAVALHGLPELEEIQGPEPAAEALRAVARALTRALGPGTPIARVGPGELAFPTTLGPTTLGATTLGATTLGATTPGATTAGATTPGATTIGAAPSDEAGLEPERSLAPIAAAALRGIEEARLADVEPRIGVALVPEHGREPAGLLRCALLATRHPPGRPGTVAVYRPSADRRAARRSELLAGLRRALRQARLELVHQPKVDTWTGLPVGTEALVRWRDPELGTVSPSEFVPLAEEADLIEPLTRQVLKLAIAEQAALRGQGLELRVAVNLSARSLDCQGAGPALLRLVDELGGGPAGLGFEVTETALLQSGRDAVAELGILREAGYAVALDDFGVGYSSFARLRDLPVSAVKIDRALVRVLPGDRSGALVLASVLELAEKLGLETVGEGVEDAADLERLRTLGCTLAQGYHIARPMPAAELGPWLRARLRRAPPRALAGAGGWSAAAAAPLGAAAG